MEVVGYGGFTVFIHIFTVQTIIINFYSCLPCVDPPKYVLILLVVKVLMCVLGAGCSCCDGG